jgi:hypothetical protein
VLRHGGELLIEQNLEVVVVRFNGEWPTLKIQPSMSYDKDQANELVLIRCERCVAGGELLAEECDRTMPLVKHSTDAHPGCIAFDDEALVEVGEL